jgi:integrase
MDTIREDFYHVEKKLEKLMDAINKSRDISQKNKQNLLDFYRNILMIDKIKSKITVLNMMGLSKTIVIWLNRINKDFLNMTEKEISNFIFEKIDNQNYEHNTKVAYRTMIKRLFVVLGFPDKVKMIRTGKCEGKKYSMHLTQEEFKRMIEVATNPRDKAIIAVLADTPWRLGELATLKIKDKKIIDEPKTGKQIGFLKMEISKTFTREVPIKDSIPYLIDWINVHPKRNDPESYIWITRNKNMKILSGYGFRSVLKRLAKLAGIDPARVYITAFRHSVNTELGLELSESTLAGLVGWVQGSRMA